MLFTYLPKSVLYQRSSQYQNVKTEKIKCIKNVFFFVKSFVSTLFLFQQKYFYTIRYSSYKQREHKPLIT